MNAEPVRPRCFYCTAEASEQIVLAEAGNRWVCDEHKTVPERRLRRGRMRDDRRRAYDDDRATALAPAPVDPAIERATARADEILRRAEEEAATAIMNAREMAERLIMDARRGAAKEIEVAQEQCNELLAHAMRRWEELTEFERELEERTERVEEVLHALRTALSGEKTPVAPGAPDGRQLGRAEEDILLDLSDQAAVEDGRL